MAQDHIGGKYFVKPLSLGKCKLGYYEFEGEDKEPEEEEDSIRTKRLRLKYKPIDFKKMHSTPNYIRFVLFGTQDCGQTFTSV